MLRKNRPEANPSRNNSGSRQADAGSYDNRDDAEYPSRRGIGDLYSRKDRRVEEDRSELFAGYNPEKARTNRFVDGPSLRKDPVQGEETEEDVEGIKQQTRFIKQESVNSTRNALRLAREAEETARATVDRLADQSEKLANTERHLDVTKTHADRAADKTDELKQLNRSIFRPVITWNKDAKRAAQEAKIQARYEEDRDAREQSMKDIRETKDRLRGGGEDEEGIGGIRAKFRSAEEQEQRKVQRKRFQFEATASDDELEDELDDNLEQISKATKSLNLFSRAMGDELEQQNNRIERIEKKTVKVDDKVTRNTDRLLRIGK